VSESSRNRAPRLPDFIAVGPPRTATTWLHEVLQGHVCLPADRKETDFFTRFYDRGIDWYADYFRHCEGGIPVGELSPMYFASSPARERIARHLPECKIIVSLRDPVERAYSNYRMLRRIVATKVDFEQAATTRGDLIESSRYGTHLADWFARFGRERVQVLIYDDLESDSQAFLDSICDFIGIPRFPISSSKVGAERVLTVNTQPLSPRLAKLARDVVGWFVDRRYHRAANRVRGSRIIRYMLEGGDPFPPLDPEVANRLREYYRPEVEKLEQLIGRDLSAWKLPRAAAS
jgi:Sulfotransferase domain